MALSYARGFGAAAALLTAGCLIDATGVERTEGDGGAGTTTSTGVTGCSQPSDCPAPNTCSNPTCDAGVCGSTPRAAGSQCGDGVTQACDGMGFCLGLPGRNCAAPSECLSGFCADGVCCGSACDGACESCAIPPSPGTCLSYAAATDPEMECGGGVCDGVGECANGDPLDALSFPSSGEARAWFIEAHPAGGFVVGGDFWGTLDLGAFQLNSNTSTVDVFVARFDATGQPVWARGYGGNLNDGLDGLSVDPSTGDIAISGRFRNTINVGGATLTSAGGADHFVAKLDPMGALIWARQFGDLFDQASLAVAFAADGGLVLAGALWSDVDFGGGVLDDAGGWDALLVRLDASGGHVFSKRFGDGGGQVFSDVAVGPAGEIWAIGTFWGAIDFGTGPLTGAGGWDVMLVKFEPDGDTAFAQRYGDGADQQGRGVGIDGQGTVHFAAGLSGSADFGGGVLTSAGGYDVVLGSRAGDGTFLSARRFGDVASQLPYGLDVDGGGRVVMAGDLYGAIDFGAGALTSAGAADVFVATFAASGEHLWSSRHGDALDQYGNDVALLANGETVVAGHFYGTIDFGGEMISGPGPDPYVLRFSP